MNQNSNHNLSLELQIEILKREAHHLTHEELLGAYLALLEISRNLREAFENQECLLKQLVKDQIEQGSFPSLSAFPPKE